jgi:hypothetical protein
MTLYLKNAAFVDCKAEVKHLRCVEEGRQGHLPHSGGPIQDKLASGDRVLDCTGKLVTKSFMRSSSHLLYSGSGMPHRTRYQSISWRFLSTSGGTGQVPRPGDDRGERPGIGHLLRQERRHPIIDHTRPLCDQGSLFTIGKAFDRVGLSICSATRSPTGTEGLGMQGSPRQTPFCQQGIRPCGTTRLFHRGRRASEERIALARSTTPVSTCTWLRPRGPGGDTRQVRQTRGRASAASRRPGSQGIYSLALYPSFRRERIDAESRSG